MLLEKDNLNTTEVPISKTLFDSYISHDRFFWVNNVLREYNKMKLEIKNPETSVKHIILKQWKPMCHLWEKYCKQNRLMLL